VVAIADELDNHAETVVIVPKDCRPEKVPDRFRVGIPAQTDWGSNAPWSVWDYRDCGPVHLLGGSPSVQAQYTDYLDVASVDTASPLKAASYGDVWTGDQWTERPDLGYYERMIRSYGAHWDDLNDASRTDRVDDSDTRPTEA
jgi:hypothetical protein